MMTHEQLSAIIEEVAKQTVKLDKIDQKNKRKAESKTFSKNLIVVFIIPYMILVLLGFVASVYFIFQYPDSFVQVISALCGLIGIPLTVAAPFYFNKAKAENVLKISQSLQTQIKEGKVTGKSLAMAKDLVQDNSPDPSIYT